MAIFDPFGEPSRLLFVSFVVVIGLAGVATVGAFVADPGDATPAPVVYDDTVELGLSSETDELMAASATLPRMQVFYSQLPYVVGYNGVESFVDRLDDEHTATQFGYPLVAYVETFDRRDPGVTDDGLFRAADPTGVPEWVPAEEAVYVVDSDAQTPAGETVIPFSTRAAAAEFASESTGTVVDWETLRATGFDVDSAATVRAMAPDRWATADTRLAAGMERADRPTETVVGEDAPTVQAAIDSAPANTTVRIPSGTYEETLAVNRSLSIVGDNARIVGEGNGSVITVRAPAVAIQGVAVSGTGNLTRDPDAARDTAAQAASEDADSDETWDTNIQLGYGHGDAGIRAIDAPGLFVDDVSITTDASGVLLRDGSDAVLHEVRVDGATEWRDGFMGVTGIESQVTVTDSEFTDGRDGVYLHRADGSVVRNSTFTANRYGTHLMYTGDALIADNTVRNTEFGGITVMTRPARNAIVGNDVRHSAAGIQASGTQTYIGYNTLAHNRLGLSTSSRGSVYEHNVLVANEQGARATTVVPASTVTANDFVANDDHASAGAGALRIWADGDRGNYWDGAAVGFHTPGERAYRPTSPVDSSLHRDPAAITLRESPANVVLARLYGTVPGARSGSIIDPSPATGPFAPDRVASATATDGDPIHGAWRTAPVTHNQTAVTTP